MKKSINLVLALVTYFSIQITLGQEVASRTVEDGGTVKYSAIMTSQASLPTHTVFRPQDMSKFGKNEKLLVIAWGNGACFNSPWEHVNFLSEVASHGFLVIAIGIIPKESGGAGERPFQIKPID
jgi:hypothetical protein